MTILCRVCADFHDRSGRPVFTVGPREMNCVLVAPDAIREDPLFDLLIQDGSLEAVQSIAQRKALENDPLNGVSADGKRITLKPVSETPGSPALASDSAPASEEIPLAATPADQLAAASVDQPAAAAPTEKKSRTKKAAAEKEKEADPSPAPQTPSTVE